LKPRPSRSSRESRSIGGTEEGRALLQERLALFGKVCFLVNLFYYPLFNLAVALVPGNDLSSVLASLFSYEALGEFICFGTLWAVCRRGAYSARTLGLIDVVSMLTIGATTAMWPFVHLSPVLGTYELVLAHLALLSLRATLVPSTGRRTLLVGLGVCGTGLVSVLVASRLREVAPLTPGTVSLLALSWMLVATAFSTVVSSVIYGLRQQVRDARKLGQYTLHEHLGSGAMGSVYLASHALLRRRTAIKLLNPDAGARALERFEREVQLTSQLTHPNTIAIYDYGHTEDGLFYYAMEYLDGVDLEGLVASTGPLPPARAVHILRQVCGALEEAHGQGLLHRDIKPANIFLCRRRGEPDMVKVLDFGLVKELGAPKEAAITQSSTLTGTPLYLSPEAISQPEGIDARSDLYSVGAVGYFLLTGRPLFEGHNLVEICAHHLHSSPVPPAERLGRPLPEALSQLVLRCLEKNPRERFASARELRQALAACTQVGQWSEEDAERWWEQHGQAVARARRGERRLLTGTQTLVREVAGQAA
jgi:serine/threonine-protein kinase